MSYINTDVSNYTLSELMAIIDVNQIDPHEIVNKTNKLSDKFKDKDPKLSTFFKSIQSQLLQYSQGLLVKRNQKDLSGKIVVESFDNMSSTNNDAEYPVGKQQTNDLYNNEYLKQTDENQTNKITNRKQKIKVYNNQHAPMNRQQLATTDTFQLPIKQDSLNPNLKNTISRFVNLDSQFRQYTGNVSSSSTDYTLDLSDTLKNALSLRLYSYQIPFSWYVIDICYGNTCLWIIDPGSNTTVLITVPAGNYSQSGFQTQLNLSFTNAGFTFPTYPPYVTTTNSPVYYNANNGIITLYLYNGSFNGIDIAGIESSFTITETTYILFYDFSGTLQCSSKYYSKTNYFNNTLGWLMGYRLPYILIDPSGNMAPSILDLNGPKYLILVIDDYNQNHVNNTLVSITQFTSTLSTPSYYSPDLPYTCFTPAQQGSNLIEIVNQTTAESVFTINQTTNTENGLLIGGKYRESYTNTVQVLPSAPRTITQAQITTINEINKNQNTNYLSKAPTSADILGVLPIKTSIGVPTGSLLVEFSGSLQDNVRTYFGPVNIERMAIRLLDDKGNILNLNGNDWCVTLVCECLYQY